MEQETRYQIKIELLTETLFGNGEAIPGFVDIDIQTDKNGLPFLKAKTLKGLIRENAELLAMNFGISNDVIIDLFGNEKNAGRIRFTDAELSEVVKEALTLHIENGKFTKEELKRAITSEYSYTKLKNGVAQGHSLRTVRMLNKGMFFYADVVIENPVRESIEEQENQKEQDKCLLGSAVSLLKHVGTLKSKGKGYVMAELLYDGNNIIAECLKNL